MCDFSCKQAWCEYVAAAAGKPEKQFIWQVLSLGLAGLETRLSWEEPPLK